MRIFGYFGIALLIWLSTPAISLAEAVPVQGAASGTAQPQPIAEEEDLLSTLD